jgi:peroxiredoxin
MGAWAESLGVEHSEANDDEGRITFLGDPEGVLTRTLEMELTHPGPASVGIVGRCKRFALYAVGGVVKYVAVSEADDDPAGDERPEATLAEAMLKAIVSLKEEL